MADENPGHGERDRPDEAVARIERRLEAIESRLSSLESGAGASRSGVVDRGPTPPTEPSAAGLPSTRPTAAASRSAAPTSGRGGASGVSGGLNLEVLLGGRAFAVFGSLVVIVAVGLALKLAWDEGYLRVPPAGRCLIAAGFGLVLMGAGEFVRLRFNRWAAFAFTAAGLGTAYTAAWASHGYFGLVGAGAGLGLLAGVAALGVGLSAWSGVVWVAALSLAGGFAAPLLLEGGAAPAWVMPAYFLALLVVGLALAAWRGAGFAAARTVGAVGAATLGAALAFSRGGEDAAVSVVYFALLVALTHGELVWSAALGRLGIVRGGGAASVDAAGDAIGGRSGGAIARWLAHRFGGVSGLVLSPAVTGVSVATAVHVVGLTDAAGWRWAVAAAGAVALVVAGRTLLGRTERDEAAGDARPVGVVLFAEGLALVFAAVLLGFAGWAEPAVFLGLGAAVAIASRTRDIAWMAWYGLASLALGTLRAVMHEASAHAFSGPHTFIAGVAWSRWSLLAFAAAVCWGVGAWGVGGAALGARSARRAASSAWVIAAALLFAAPLHERTEAASLVYLWIGLAATLVAYRFLLLSRRSDAPTDLPPTTLERAGLGSTMASALAAGGLVLGLGAWAAAFGPSRSVAWRDSPSALFFHPGFIAAIVWSVVAGAFAMAHRPAPGAAGAGRDAVLRAVGVWAAGVMVFATSSLEVARAAFALTDNELSQRAAVSLWWGVYGAAVLLAGWWRSVGAARVTGLVLILVASAKALLYDIAGVEPVWRVVALLGLGLLMMVVAAFYLRGRIARPGSNAEPGDRLRDAGGGDGGVAEA